MSVGNVTENIPDEIQGIPIPKYFRVPCMHSERLQADAREISNRSASSNLRTSEKVLFCATSSRRDPGTQKFALIFKISYIVHFR